MEITQYSKNCVTLKKQEYAELLYIQAALIEGISPEDPVDFGNKISQIMAK